MKLWWVHLEAMVATLMAYQHTNSQEHHDNFVKIFKYTFDKVEQHMINVQISHHLTPSSLWPVESGQATWTGREGSRWISREDLTRDAFTSPEL